MNTKCPSCNKNVISINYLNCFSSGEYNSTNKAFACKECMIIVLYNLNKKLDGMYYNDYYIDNSGNIHSCAFYYYGGEKFNIYNKYTLNILNLNCKANLIYNLNNTYTSSVDLLNVLKKVIDNGIFI